MKKVDTEWNFDNKDLFSNFQKITIFSSIVPSYHRNVNIRKSWMNHLLQN